ncbi:hypothetical protein KXD40_004256 [Peronospora effusa]|uniref:Uncharacterized protein n=1 Tax=Peronospora effusa TaxID=542832 RepID=A0A3R7W3T0_9STRA|nr:hypothetical protein DD237_005132 [Peronospora effusa]UIZ28329.1 hypothetical protein KXD40_004256 [Peronospora effusa]
MNSTVNSVGHHHNHFHCTLTSARRQWEAQFDITSNIKKCCIQISARAQYLLLPAKRRQKLMRSQPPRLPPSSPTDYFE